MDAAHRGCISYIESGTGVTYKSVKLNESVFCCPLGQPKPHSEDIASVFVMATMVFEIVVPKRLQLLRAHR